MTFYLFFFFFIAFPYRLRVGSWDDIKNWKMGQTAENYVSIIKLTEKDKKVWERERGGGQKDKKSWRHDLVGHVIDVDVFCRKYLSTPAGRHVLSCSVDYSRQRKRHKCFQTYVAPTQWELSLHLSQVFSSLLLLFSSFILTKRTRIFF